MLTMLSQKQRIPLICTPQLQFLSLWELELPSCNLTCSWKRTAFIRWSIS